MLLAADKPVLLLDEPMAGLSAEHVPQLVELIRSVHEQERKTVLMVEHHMDVVTGHRAADRGHAPRRAPRVRHAGRGDGERDRPVGLPRGGAVSARRDRRTLLLACATCTCYLGQSHILQGVSFDVPEGGVTALLGRNGVGKTTTLRAILGLVGAPRLRPARRTRS